MQAGEWQTIFVVLQDHNIHTFIFDYSIRVNFVVGDTGTSEQMPTRVFSFDFQCKQYCFTLFNSY